MISCEDGHTDFLLPHCRYSDNHIMEYLFIFLVFIFYDKMKLLTLITVIFLWIQEYDYVEL